MPLGSRRCTTRTFHTCTFWYGFLHSNPRHSPGGAQSNRLGPQRDPFRRLKIYTSDDGTAIVRKRSEPASLVTANCFTPCGRGKFLRFFKEYVQQRRDRQPLEPHRPYSRTYYKDSRSSLCKAQSTEHLVGGGDVARRALRERSENIRHRSRRLSKVRPKSSLSAMESVG